MSNDNIATFIEPPTFNRVAAFHVLRASGWTLDAGWALVTTMRDLLIQHPGIFNGAIGEAEILDTSGNGTPVKGRLIVEALKTPRKEA